MGFEKPTRDIHGIFHLSGVELRDGMNVMIKWPDGHEELRMIHCEVRTLPGSTIPALHYWIVIEHHSSIINVSIRRASPDITMAWPEPDKAS